MIARKLKRCLKNVLQWFFDFLLPKSEHAKNLEKMSAEEFFALALPYPKDNPPNTKTIFSYQDKLVKDTIWLLKYQHDPNAIKLLGEIMANSLFEWLENLETFENFNNPIIIPVPMSKDRNKKRGGNHTEMLCAEIIKQLPYQTAEYCTDCLKKIKETKRQVDVKDKILRLQNLVDSFEAKPEKIRSRNIVLVDDIITTGATLNECKKVLMKAGAKKVIFFAISH
jgi:competence protein ComFC